MERHHERGASDDGVRVLVDTEPTARRTMVGDQAHSQTPRRDEGIVCAVSFPAAVLALVPAVPLIATAATVLIYAGRPNSGLTTFLKEIPLLGGTLIALALSLLLAVIYRFFFTAADHANTRNFGELAQRLEQLRARLRICSESVSVGHMTSFQKIACEEAKAHCRAVERELPQGGLRGLQWTSGAGYVNMWSVLHRAEEALIEAEPTESVVAGALYDELRIEGSTIENRAQLLNKLRRAVVTLSPSAAIYLNQQPPALTEDVPEASRGGAHDLALDDQARGTSVAVISATGDARANDGTDPPTMSLGEREARAVLREVRRSLNEFRDDSRDGLVRLRNRLMVTLTFTGLVTYVLLGFVIDTRKGNAPENPMQDALLAATAIYLTGAIVGLFNRLYSESGEDAAVEDYGLARARLLLTPVLSGLAAVGGVLITAMLLGLVNGGALTPQPTTPPAVQAPAARQSSPPATAVEPGTAQTGSPDDGSPAGGPPRLTDIFNLQRYPFSLIIAAIFGLTPGLLINRLKKESEQYKADLQSTEPQLRGGSLKGVEALQSGGA